MILMSIAVASHFPALLATPTSAARVSRNEAATRGHDQRGILKKRTIARRGGTVATKQSQTRRDEELIAQYIAPHPKKPGADQAIIAGHDVSVWALIGYLHGTSESVPNVAADYDLPVEAMEAAMAYYQQYKALIDSRIAVNDAAFDQGNSRKH